MLKYDDFKVYFKNVDISEDEFDKFNNVAENLAWQYLGYKPSKVDSTLQFAIGLIIQKIYARGMRAKDLPSSESEGGVNRSYNNEDILSEEITNILDLFRRPTL